MTTQSCPHCGAKKRPKHSRYFICGTNIQYVEDRYQICYENELDAKDAEIEGLEFEAAVGRKLTELLRSGATITGSPDCLTKDVDGGINGKLVIKYPEGEMK